MAGASRIGDGRCIVQTAGTRCKLNAGTGAGSVSDSPGGPVKSVAVTAILANTGIVVVGGPNCVAALATRRGTPLAAGQSYAVDTDDLGDVYVDAMVSGEGVVFSYSA